MPFSADEHEMLSVNVLRLLLRPVDQSLLLTHPAWTITSAQVSASSFCPSTRPVGGTEDFFFFFAEQRKTDSPLVEGMNQVGNHPWKGIRSRVGDLLSNSHIEV